MKNEKKSRGEELGEAVREKGIALSIPTVLLAYPITGALAGKFLADYFDRAWILPLILVLSLFLALRETISLLKRLGKQRESK